MHAIHKGIALRTLLLLLLLNKRPSHLNINITKHEKLPDTVLYDQENNWLFLIEAVTSHGPISDKRMIEIKEMLSDSSAHLIFVTAFPDFKTFQKYASEISWETEVWISKNPDHMIHFNGDKFLGPEKQ